MRALGSPVLSSRATPADAAQAVYRSIWAALAEWRLLTLPSRLSGEGPRSRRAGLTVLELALQQYERIGSHVGVQQRAVPVVSFAAVKHQPIAPAILNPFPLAISGPDLPFNFWRRF